LHLKWRAIKTLTSVYESFFSLQDAVIFGDDACLHETPEGVVGEGKRKMENAMKFMFFKLNLRFY
jgi:hypothetical protein